MNNEDAEYIACEKKTKHLEIFGWHFRKCCTAMHNMQDLSTSKQTRVKEDEGTGISYCWAPHRCINPACIQPDLTV